MSFYRTFLLLSVFLVCVAVNVAFSQDASLPVAESATGPEGLLELEQQGKVTVRALRAWGRLPDTYVKLARQLRQEAGLDLLGADLAQISAWISQAEGGDAGLAKHLSGFKELEQFMRGGGHLDWVPVPADASMPAGTLVRSGGTRWTQAADGPVAAPDATAQAAPVQAEPVQAEPVQAAPVQAESAQAEPVQAEPVQAEPVQAEPVQAAPVQAETASGEAVQSKETDTAASLPPAAPSDSGPQDGVEFSINDQVSGTYRVKLKVDGLTVAKPEDDPYFQRRLQAMLPGAAAVVEGERSYFAKLSEYTTVNPALEGNASYDLVLGFATPDTPVVIRVDAPENPEIPLTEQEILDKVSYRVVGKSVYVYRYDEAAGDADIGFEESHDGEVRWTPRVDSSSGRPVGPRALGVYMAYRVKKYVGDSELGTLGTSPQRIGWVVMAMPGDVYEHEGTLYAVGREDSLSAGGSSGPAPAPETFDFELSQYALAEKAIRISDDLRHVAWIEGEKKGQKRVVVNGVPGKWYDDVKGYSMRFAPAGENFCFEAELGDKEVSVCNGADGPVFDEIDFLDMTADGAHVLVGGKVGGVNRVYLDGKQVRETSVPVRDGTVARNGKAAWIEWGRDEQSGAEFAMIVTADGFMGQKYPAIHGTPLFTQNRAELYYIAEKEGGNRFLVRDGEELQPTMGYGYKFTVTPDGAFYAYVGHMADTVWSMVVNGQIGPDFDDIWDPATFSPDGQRHIYTGKKGNEAFLVVDGQIFTHGFGAPKEVRDVTFSPDGQRWAAAFQLSDEEYVIVVDGKEYGRGQGFPRRIVFSSDGSRVAWLERREKSWRAFLDGQAGPEFQEIFLDEPPQFSPDGRHLVYFSFDAKRKMHITVFGGEDLVHDMIPPLAAFTDQGVQYLALDGNRFRRQVIPLP